MVWVVRKKVSMCPVCREKRTLVSIKVSRAGQDFEAGGYTAYDPQIAMNRSGDTLVVRTQEDAAGDYQVFTSLYRSATRIAWTSASAVPDLPGSLFVLLV